MSSTSAINSLLSSTSTANSAIDLSNILASETGATTPGIDVNAAVTAALYADRAPERVWQADQTTLSSQTTALTSIQSATQALQNDLQSLNTLSGAFAARNVTSSDSDYVSATAASGTTTGVHTVVVNGLASQGAWYSDMEASGTATLPNSSMTLTTASGSITIPTGSGQTGDTLNDLATAINGANLGVTATVMSGSTGAQLAIVGNSTGAANDFSITSPNYTGKSWTSPDLPSGSTLGTNSVTISNAAGASVTVQSTSGESYTDFAAAINTAISAYNATAATPLSVTAAAGADAHGTHLTVASSDGSSFTISEPALGFTQAVQASDANATIDGIPFTSSTNTITGAVAGVTINLMGNTRGVPVSLTVAPDSSQISSAINQFVTDYNSAIGLVNAQFTLTSSTNSSGATTQSEGVLAPDATVQGLQSTLEAALGFAYKPASGTTTVSSLANLGITMNDDGTLSVNSTTLNNALITSPSDVQNFFQGSALNGFANNFYSALNTYTSPANGAFTVDLQSIQAENTSLSQQISDFETGYIASQQAQLLADFSKAEIALQSLPEQMQQLNAELGFNNTNNG